MHPWIKSPIADAIAAVGQYHEALLKAQSAVEITDEHYFEISSCWNGLSAAQGRLDKLAAPSGFAKPKSPKG